MCTHHAEACSSLKYIAFMMLNLEAKNYEFERNLAKDHEDTMKKPTVCNN